MDFLPNSAGQKKTTKYRSESVLILHQEIAEE